MAQRQNAAIPIRRVSLSVRWSKQGMLQLFVLAGLRYLLVFSYTPMFGIIIAFKKYSIVSGIPGFFTSPWVGLKHFREFFTDYRFPQLLRNTLVICSLKLVFAFPIPIVFAVMINEIRNRAFKRVVQTVSYFPHFISWVVITGMLMTLFSENNGAVNELLTSWGYKPLAVMTNPDAYWALAVLSDVWKETGWWTIIFLAAITGIDQSLYEAAHIDGAGRLKCIRFITLPSIKGSVMVVLILALGSFLGGGLSGSNFEQSLLLGNPLNNTRSEIIQSYSFKVGLTEGRFDYAAAVDLVQSLISVTLVFSSNAISRKISGSSLF